MAGIYLVTADRVRAIVDVKVIVAVQLKVVETEHEPLKDAVCLEGDGAVEVLLELRLQNRPVYLPVQISHVILLAHVAYVICEWERFIIRSEFDPQFLFPMSGKLNILIFSPPK